MNRNSLSAQAQTMRSAQELTQGVAMASQQAVANVTGSQVDMGTFLQKIPSLPSITYFLDNSGAGVDNTFIIGDPTGMVDVVEGGGTLNPTEVQGRVDLVTPNKEFFKQIAVAYSSINYLTSSTPTQFNKRFEIVIVNSVGNSSNETINLASATRNTAENDKLLTLTGQWLLDIHRGLVVTVLAGEAVTITLTPSAYTV